MVRPGAFGHVCVYAGAAFIAVLSACAAPEVEPSRTAAETPRDIPNTWDEERLASMQLPLADARISVRHLPASQYRELPVRVMYKTYPIYHPDREPPGYLAYLAQQEPQVETFDLPKDDASWARYGAAVFQLPSAYAALNQAAELMTRFGEFVPVGQDMLDLPPSQKSRYSDERLFALATYIYSLRPPANPYAPRTALQRAAVARGKAVFERLKCGLCHRPPQYTTTR